MAPTTYLTRKRVLAAAPGITSEEGAAFFARVQAGFPFPIWAVQVGGGSEFMGSFAESARAAEVAHYVNRPNYPQGQGRVERSFLTDVLEHFKVDGYPSRLDQASRRLAAWNVVYEDIRPAPGPRLPDAERVLRQVAARPYTSSRQEVCKRHQAASLSIDRVIGLPSTNLLPS